MGLFFFFLLHILGFRNIRVKAGHDFPVALLDLLKCAKTRKSGVTRGWETD